MAIEVVGGWGSVVGSAWLDSEGERCDDVNEW